MTPISPVPLPWLLELVNEFSPQARLAAGKEHARHPDIWVTPSAPRLRVGKRSMVTVAEQLWRIFAGSDAERAASLNELVSAATLSPWIGSDGQLGWRSPLSGDRDRLLAGCTATLITVVGALGWARLGICAGSGCQDVYADSAGRGSRRYCSKTCLNRARVRAYRLRHAD